MFYNVDILYKFVQFKIRTGSGWSHSACTFDPVCRIRRKLPETALRTEIRETGRQTGSWEQFFYGDLAQLARAFDWQSKGQGFDSPNLHISRL